MDGLVQNIVCLDSSNCNQMKAFFHSTWEIPPSCFLFSLYCFQGAFHSVVNCTCSLLFFSIFHFFFTTFVQRPFSAKTIQGSLHLICIINRLPKRARWQRYTKVVSRSPHPTSLVTLPPEKYEFFVLFNYVVRITNCSR